MAAPQVNQKERLRMAQTMPEPPKRSNTWLIVAIVVVVVCCLCLVIAGAAWQFGDQILRALGVTP